MANNKNTRTINSTVLLNKVDELSNRLKIISQATDIGQTQQEMIIEANQLLNTFFNQIADPLFNPDDVLPDLKPDVTVYNENFNSILSDLKILFLELSNIGNIELTNFNFMISDNNRLIGRMKSVYSKLGDYILFSNDPNKDSLYFSDTFNNLDRIDYNSKLLDAAQANIDQDQGVITLPIDNTSYSPIQITNTPVVNNNSNGTPGNNHEAGAALNNNILNILDDNADTWFEYENVILDNTVTPVALILDITLNLGTSQIINYIRVNPNNFGTKNSIIIDAIETSADGKIFFSIKDDMPSAAFDETETDLFTIAPSSSKYAGQALYTFTPRYAKYIHFTFRQTTPYGIIDDTGTSRDRYAIGIRDIEIDAIPFANTGEIISLPYAVNDEVKKVALMSNQFPPTDLTLVSIEHYVSGDNGLTWTQLNPTNVEATDTSIPEIVNFNTLDNNSVQTAAPVTSLQYKAVLNRDDSSFSNPTNFQTTHTENASELLPIPNTSPFNLLLNGTPIQNSIKLIDPTFGSRGLNSTRYILGTGNGSSLSIITPFLNVNKDKTKVLEDSAYVLQDLDPEQIRVNGKLWTRGSLNLSTASDQVYQFDYTSGKIDFGDNVNGQSPPTGAIIDMMFLPEKLSFSSGDKHIATLDYPASNDKDSFVITQYGADVTVTEILAKQALISKLNNSNLNSAYTPTFSNITIFATEQSFIDGFSELVNPGDYSIDYLNGIVYFNIRTDATTDVTINYKYTSSTVLDSSNWDFVDNTNYTEITINDNIFLGLNIINESIPVGARHIVLQNFSILPNSLSFSGPNATTYFFKEVPFIDGDTELNTAIQTVESMATSSTIPGLYPLTTDYIFRLPVSMSSNLKISFSNMVVFETEVSVPGDIISAGQYCIDRSNNKVIFFSVTSGTDLGITNYYYDDSMKSANGLYSVNYKTGEIFTSLSTGAALTISYNYSNYIAQYSIARVVDSNDFAYDSTTNSVNISEREILKRVNLNIISSQTNFYQVLYQKVTDDASQLQALAPYFTPILRDYALKVITESSLAI